MSDESTVETATEAAGNGGFTAPTTQEEFNAMVADRIKRERAKYADYSDLKSKASKFDELAEAQKTETQRAIERAEAAERALADKSMEALRLSVIAKHGIPEEYQEFVTGADEAELNAKAEKVKSLIPAPTEQANTVRELMIPGEGRSPATALNGDGLEAALKAKLGIA